MLKGLYSAASGMSVNLRQTDIIANNLANSSTPGFKRELLAAGSFLGLGLQRLEPRSGFMSPVSLPSYVGGLATGVVAAESGVDPRGGVLELTGNDWDLAIDGPGFFAVDTGTEVVYTRRGDLKLGPDGMITLGDGSAVLGEAGPLSSPVAGRLSVSPAGELAVLTDDGSVVIGRLQIVEFASAAGLARHQQGGFVPTELSGPAEPAAGSEVRQGYLEKSNAHPVEEMVELIAAYRSYEATQKAVHALNDALGRAVSDVGRVV